MSAESNVIRIMVVDDHPLLLEGIAGLVAIQPDMKMVAEASNGHEAIQQFRVHRPDITLMDLQMPKMNRVATIIAIRGEFHEARIIVLTTPGSARPQSWSPGLSVKEFSGKGIVRCDPSSPFWETDHLCRGRLRNGRAHH
jgi:CheY-like chemotaxis protein